MKFRCENCGAKLSVAGSRAGKTGKCPRCKQVVAVPLPAVEGVVAGTDDSGQGEIAPQSSAHDPLLLDVLPADARAGGSAADADDTGAAYQRLQALQCGYVVKEPEEPPQRRLPWIIDIFLYPLNTSGMTMLMLSVGIPLVLRVLLRFSWILMSQFGALLILNVLLIIAHWGTLLLFLLYVNWYACECIRDSAAGGIRAVDTTASTPGLGELLAQSFQLLVTAAVCMAPALIYLAKTHNTDGLFWIMYGIGGFLFPMALLAVVMFESLRALNPVLLLGSTLSAFLPYCALVVFSYILCLLIPVAGYCVVRIWTVGYLVLFLAFYQLLVLAHLLGRFHWKYQGALSWDT